MSAPRLAGLLLFALCLAVAAVSAQPGLPPGVKMPPVIKPGTPPGGPKLPGPGDPKQKIPMPPAPGPGTPGKPGTPPGPGGPSGTMPSKPTDKKDDTKWPDKVGGKTLAEVVKEMRGNSDPAVREGAVRALAAFGPKAREVGGQDLVDAMTKDPDWNVRAAALEAGPTVLYFQAKSPDTVLNSGVTAMVKSMGSSQLGIRVTAIVAVGSIGSYMRMLSPQVITELRTQARDTTTWQLRRLAVAAVGSVGQGLPLSDDGDQREPPDTGAVTLLIDVAKTDNCALVRRDAINALIGLGPVAGGQQKKWRSDLDQILKTERDKSVILWTRVCILRNDPAGVTGNPIHLDAVAKTLEAPEAQGRIEACQALGILGEEAKSKLQDLLDVIQNDKEEPLVVAAAILAVAGMKSQVKIIQPILESVKNSHKNADVRKVAQDGIEYVTGRKK